MKGPLWDHFQFWALRCTNKNTNLQLLMKVGPTIVKSGQVVETEQRSQEVGLDQ